MIRLGVIAGVLHQLRHWHGYWHSLNLRSRKTKLEQISSNHGIDLKTNLRVFNEPIFIVSLCLSLRPINESIIKGDSHLAIEIVGVSIINLSSDTQWKSVIIHDVSWWKKKEAWMLTNLVLCNVVTAAAISHI